MKSRELQTTPVVIVSSYSINPLDNGKYLHSFTPQSTSTRYQFEANKEPVLKNGERYNIGFTVDESGQNWVDTSAIAKADDVDPAVSHYFARTLGEQIREVNVRKSDDRVTHGAKDGKYLGSKYAWRIYGMAVARETFEDYLDAIKHPKVPCLTEGSPSTAYKEQGLKEAMDQFFKSVEKIANNRFKSPLLPARKWFQIKGLTAITDKK